MGRDRAALPAVEGARGVLPSDAGPAIRERPARRWLRRQPRLQPNFDYVPKDHLPGNGGSRPEADARVEGLAEPLCLARARVPHRRRLRRLHNQAPATPPITTATRPRSRYTPTSISAQILQNPTAHSAGRRPASSKTPRARQRRRLARHAEGRPPGVRRHALPAEPRPRGLGHRSYQLRGSASALRRRPPAPRQLGVEPRLTAKVHELAVRDHRLRRRRDDRIAETLRADLDPQLARSIGPRCRPGCVRGRTRSPRPGRLVLEDPGREHAASDG